MKNKETIITIACPKCRNIVSAAVKNSITVDWTEEVVSAKERGFLVEETTDTVIVNKCTCDDNATAYGYYGRGFNEIRIELPLSNNEVELLFKILLERNNANERNREKTLSGQKAMSQTKRDAYDAEIGQIQNIMDKITDRTL